MFLLRPHDFMRGRLAHSLGYGGAGDTVLGGGDPVCDALSRHPTAGKPATEHKRFLTQRHRVALLTVWVSKGSTPPDNTETDTEQRMRRRQAGRCRW